jgi:RNA 3'-phosphate cyclase
VLRLDGSYGEGGGQVLRTALALAVVLQRPVRVTGIRAGRRKPGLQAQHLTAVRALAAVGDAEVTGGEIGSTDLSFVPHGLHGGTHRFDIGTAGAVSLVFQALLLPLALAGLPSHVRLIGGTHVPWSPPFHYLRDVYLPALAEIGVCAQVTLRRWGWYPRGGGEIEAHVTPAARGRLRGFVAERRDTALPLVGLSAVSRLPRSIAERQRRRALERLAAAGVSAEIAVEEDHTACGPGTFIFLALRGRAGFAALGRRGLRAEEVADAAVEPLLSYLAGDAAVDDHLADQVLPLLALAGQEAHFTCPAISLHLTTVAWVVQQFVPVEIELAGGSPCRVHVRPGAS